jgi:hypothetical protein
MYAGSAKNCTFNSNKAYVEGDNWYGTKVPTLIFNGGNFTAAYNSGKKLLMNLTEDGVQVTDVNVTIRIYKDGVLVGTYYCLGGKELALNLNAGFYVAVLSVETQAYEISPKNITLTLTIPTKLVASAVTAIYNVNKNLVVTLKDENNKAISGVIVTIKLSNGKTVNPSTDSSGQVKLATSGLAPKTYTATITFAGNSKYDKSTKSVKVTVKKATPKFAASAKTFKVKVKTKKYVVTLKTNVKKPLKGAVVYIKVKGKTYKAKTNAKGKATFKLTKLTKKGSFKAKITFKGNAYYNKLSKTVKITVKK